MNFQAPDLSSAIRALLDLHHWREPRHARGVLPENTQVCMAVQAVWNALLESSKKVMARRPALPAMLVSRQPGTHRRAHRVVLERMLELARHSATLVMKASSKTKRQARHAPAANPESTNLPRVKPIAVIAELEHSAALVSLRARTALPGITALA